MTSEVAVMNSLGVALAADSAATVSSGRGRKVFNSADKLFMLSQRHPVGVMIYEDSSLLGIPWEAIIKMFRRSLGDQELPRLENYAKKLIDYLYGNIELFPDTAQERFYLGAVERMHRTLLDRTRARVAAALAKSDDVDEGAIAREVVLDEHARWVDEKEVTCFDAGIGERLATRFSDKIRGATAKYFSGIKIDRDTIIALRELAVMMVSKEKIFPGTLTGLVVAGFGRDDYFPVIQVIEIGEIFEDCLKHRIADTRRISHENLSEVMSFAQSEMVNTFLNGINPSSNVLMVEQVTDFAVGFPDEVIDAITDLTPEQRERWKGEFRSVSEEAIGKLVMKLEEDRQRRHLKPIEQAIASMPKDELASAAARLVSLNSFQKRMSLSEETVGGPVDVAIISKGDGFIWIDRKHYFRPELNQHFFANYYYARNHTAGGHHDDPQAQAAASSVPKGRRRAPKLKSSRRAGGPTPAPARGPRRPEG